MLLFGVEHIVGEHGVEHGGCHDHAVAHEYLHVVFNVLPDFQYFCALIERFKNINNCLRLFTFGRNRHIKCLVRLDGEAQSHQFGVDGRG